jgi:hypothetical protein
VHPLQQRPIPGRGGGELAIEVDRPDRRQRRAKGKSDPLDAYAAPDAMLSGRAQTVPKAGDGITESIRALHTVRSGAIKSRTACMNELHALVITAPAQLREELAGHNGANLIKACSGLRPTGDLADPDQGTRYALRRLACRWRRPGRRGHRPRCSAGRAGQIGPPRPAPITGVGVETAASPPAATTPTGSVRRAT